jgi:hypothetical protein
MRILELQEYAKDNGFDSVKFKYTDLLGTERTGKWIDAYFGFFTVEGMPDNELVSVSSWRKIAGDQIEFEII